MMSKDIGFKEKKKSSLTVTSSRHLQVFYSCPQELLVHIRAKYYLTDHTFQRRPNINAPHYSTNSYPLRMVCRNVYMFSVYSFPNAYIVQHSLSSLMLFKISSLFLHCILLIFDFFMRVLKNFFHCLYSLFCTYTLCFFLFLLYTLFNFYWQVSPHNFACVTLL